MPPTPWKKVEESRPGDVAAVTKLRLRRWRDVPSFLATSTRLRGRFASADGAVAVSLGASLWRREFWTLTVWRSVEAMHAYVRSPEHAGAMKRYRGRMDRAASAHWSLTGALPAWREARERLAAAPRGEGAGSRASRR